MTLDKLIRQRIEAHGEITVADYMQMCLIHPDFGYYMRRDPFGVQGDFTTSPEISQIFGELLGLWLAAQWQKQGSPKAALVELGPGRGTLMADILRATKKVKGFHESISVHLVEMSPVLRQKQWATLAGKHASINWHETIGALPDLPLFMVANEFFDAMPIHQFVNGSERMIRMAANNTFEFSLPARDCVETSPASVQIMKDIASRIAREGGAAIVIDYGYVGGSKGDTLQALRQHAYHPVLRTPGQADITAHVDFDALADAARAGGCAVYGAVSQGKFLLQIGASQRLMSLCASASESQRQSLMSGFERLISHEQMGELFKVLALLPPHAGRPEGL